MLSSLRFRSLAAGALVLLLAASAIAWQTLPLPLKLSAFAVNLGADRPSARANVVEIHIERWSTEAERSAFLSTFRQQGSEALLAAFQKADRTGYIRTPDSIGWDLRYAQATPTGDGGHRIVIATDRRISFWELYNNTRSTDYPFTVIQIQLDKDGNGEGRMSIATRVLPAENDRGFELENYSAQPVLLNSVKIQAR